MPREAAGLMEALDDAASGRAQVKNGGQLDVPVDELATSIELEDGEVLKLPPTPDMTDGREYESDPETEAVIRRSRPMLPARGLHNNSAPPPLPPRHPRRSDEGPSGDGIGLGESSSAGASPRFAPPPLPPRSRARPPSTLISPTALSFSPVSPVAAVEASITDAPPSYDESESPAGAAGTQSAPATTPVPTFLAPPQPPSPASSGSVYDDDRSDLASIGELNLGALEPGASSSPGAILAPALPGDGMPEPSPALTVPGEKYSLGPSPSSTRLHSYAQSARSGDGVRAAEGEGEGGEGLLAGTVDGEAMSESERREWEEHFEAERRRAMVPEGKGREDESLL